MDSNILILDKLTEIAEKLTEQNLFQKTVLNFNEACAYLDLSQSHLYKLTSARHIPHFCPQGKKLYFRRDELDSWLLRNRQLTNEELQETAADSFTRVTRAKNNSSRKTK
jgi:excisionase family DNA binding protein